MNSTDKAAQQSAEEPEATEALWRASGALPAAFPVLNYVEAP